MKVSFVMRRWLAYGALTWGIFGMAAASATVRPVVVIRRGLAA